jgi:uncharacterized protein (UPF0216 family)
MGTAVEDKVYDIFGEGEALGIESINLNRTEIKIKKVKRDEKGFYISNLGKKYYFSTGDLEILLQMCDEAIIESYSVNTD